MPCMCGDICCSSCGPAQGNWKCPICREWASEGCEHIFETVEGLIEIKPEFEKEIQEIEAAERAADDAFAADLEKEKEYEKEIDKLYERV